MTRMNHRHGAVALLALIATFLLAPAGQSGVVGGTRSVFAVGAGNRALAMGGAYAAIADDASAVIWNPAGRLARDLDDHFFPRVGSSLIGGANPRAAVADDFNKTARESSSDVGAFVFNAGGNPGWAISPGFKKLPDVTE